MRTFRIRFKPNPEKDKSIIQIPCFSEERKKNLNCLSKQVQFEGDLALTSEI